MTNARTVARLRAWPAKSHCTWAGRGLQARYNARGASALTFPLVRGVVLRAQALDIGRGALGLD